MIATYALCGFANCASIGIQIGVLSTFAPKKAKLFPKIALIAMIAGNITNFMNGNFNFIHELALVLYFKNFNNTEHE